MKRKTLVIELDIPDWFEYGVLDNPMVPDIEDRKRFLRWINYMADCSLAIRIGMMSYKEISVDVYDKRENRLGMILRDALT